MSSDNCRAKDPTKCRHHGNSDNSFVTKMRNALRGRNFSDYEECRNEAENAALSAPLPVSERPVVTMETANNAVRADYGSAGYANMTKADQERLAHNELIPLQSASLYMPAGVVTPEAIEAYVTEKQNQQKTRGILVEDKTEEAKRISRVAAKHVLSNAFKTNDSITVDKVNTGSLPTTEAEAIRQVENKAEAENEANHESRSRADPSKGHTSHLQDHVGSPL